MRARARLLAVVLSTALTSGCAAQPERAVLDRFFAASRLRDRTALASFATVVFEPLEQGIVTGFEIVRVVPGRDLVKTVVVEAPVKVPDGRVVPTQIDVTLESRDGRWFVTSFTLPGT